MLFFKSCKNYFIYEWEMDNYMRGLPSWTVYFYTIVLYDRLKIYLG